MKLPFLSFKNSHVSAVSYSSFYASQVLKAFRGDSDYILLCLEGILILTCGTQISACPSVTCKAW